MNAVAAILLTFATAVPDHFSDVGKKVQDEKRKASALLGFASDWISLLRDPPHTRTVPQVQTAEAVQSAADHVPDATKLMVVEPAYYVTVDFVVINHVKTYSVEFDAWDRPRIKPHETVWVSFWDRLHATFIPVGLVARGWASMSQVRNITRCSDGWMISLKNNVNVITPEIRVIESPYDWEMRNRRIYRPIRKP